MQPGVIIVSNRLPVSVKRVDGKLEYYPSIGGLATGLSSYANNRQNKWIGWPGIPNEDLSESDRIDVTKELKKHNCYPVFLTKKQLENYYNGFSNSLLWPAFHELKVKVKPPDAYWSAYRRVNNLFAEAVLSLSSRGSTIWVHDYQLLLLPAMLRARRPNDKIGFFLHIPFPKPEPFFALPHAQQLLGGLLGADLLGFHTDSYVQNFLNCCQQADIGIVEPRKLILPDRVVRVTDFPMGIDYNKFAKATKQRAVRTELLKLRAKYGRKKIILTVDRLDPTKGLVERLEAYREVLKNTPKLHGKVVMVMLAMPSRTEIPEYIALRKRVEKLVKSINQEFGTLRWQPVEYMFKSMPFEQFVALYRRADVAFIAPIKDGMNLVAKEYLATQPNKHGILILSQTAGAAEELKDAIIVDPNEKGSLASGLQKALTISPKELRDRASKMQHRIQNYTVHDWAGTFMKTLQQATPHSDGLHVTYQLTKLKRREMQDAYRRAHDRVLLLDYDGVLVSLKNKPEDAKPTKQLLSSLDKLTADRLNHVVIISGRSKDDLQTWLGDRRDLTLIAEHGGFIRPRKKARWQKTTDAKLNWKPEVRTLLRTYTEKTPGASIEEKTDSIVWHYRRANQYYAHKNLVSLKRLLWRLSKEYPIVIDQGLMILEVRSSSVHKGEAALGQLLKQTDFVLAIGDDTTDEDMFDHLPGWSHTVKVGRGRTKARFRVQNVTDVLALLKQLGG